MFLMIGVLLKKIKNLLPKMPIHGSIHSKLQKGVKISRQAVNKKTGDDKYADVILLFGD